MGLANVCQMTLRHLVLCLALLPACGSSDDTTSPASTGTGGAAGSSGAGGSATGGTAGAGGSSAGSAGNAGAAGAAACDTPPQPQTFELGTGQSCFQRLTSGQTVDVVQGPQGGYHLWLAFGCADCGATPFVEFGVKDKATGTFYPGMAGAQKLFVEASPGPWGQRAGLTAFLPGITWDQTSQLPKGTHVVLSASVLDMGTNAVLHSQDVEVVLGEVVYWNPCNPDPNHCGMPGGSPCCTKGGLDGTPPSN